MELFFKSRKLKASLEDPARCRREFGADMAAKIALRLSSLQAAESLADFWPPLSLPERCHLLKGNLAGTFSIDVKQPYRLLFIAIDVPKPEPADEKERWSLIRSIEIVGIEDTHG